MWPLVLASGIVGSRPDLVRWARGQEKLQKTDEYEVLRDSVVTKYQGVLVSGHVGPQSDKVVEFAQGCKPPNLLNFVIKKELYLTGFHPGWNEQ